MWLALINLIGGPIVSGLISAYKAHLTATTTDNQTAAELAGKQVAAQTIEVQAIYNLRAAQIGHPFEPEKLGFYLVLSYMTKCVLWDTMLGLGTTGPLRGDIAVWCGLIITFYYGKRIAVDVANIIRR